MTDDLRADGGRPEPTGYVITRPRWQREWRNVDNGVGGR